jgi:transcription elongation factor Elf1
MEEIEKFFRCPFCHQKISMILDVSVEDTQSYIEDCEVCCRPIQITYGVENGKIVGFSAVGAGG